MSQSDTFTQGASKPEGLLRSARHAAPLTLCLAIAIAHAWPELINAHELHSDGAIVGLQARHILHGEFSWFLWGSGYQTSVDSCVAALYFLLFGATPLALTLSTFCGHLLLVLCAYLTLARRFTRWESALLVLPLCVVTGPLHIYMFSPPRQAALTLAFVSIWLIDGAVERRRPELGLGLGGALAGLACLADPYALLFLPALGVFLALSAWQGDRAGRWLRLGVAFAGGCIGLVPAWLLRHDPSASHGVLDLTPGVVSHNLDLLWHVCLPYLLGLKVYYSTEAGLVDWQPGWFRVVQVAGAVGLIAGILWGGLSVLLRRGPFAERRLAALGALMLPVSLAGFAVSVMVMDRLSARYLVAIVLAAPFALGPALRALGRKRFALALAPWLVSTTVAGWLAHGSDLAGLWPAHHDLRDERALQGALRARELTRGIADYWVAYRLTFLFEESVWLVPWHESQDRYAPYRRAVMTERRVAYVFDPWRSKEEIDARVAGIEHGDSPFSRVVERTQVGRYQLLVLEKP